MVKLLNEIKKILTLPQNQYQAMYKNNFDNFFDSVNIDEKKTQII
jgi:hypothetical protein